jgi:hypothetical protein
MSAGSTDCSVVSSDEVGGRDCSPVFLRAVWIGLVAERSRGEAWRIRVETRLEDAGKGAEMRRGDVGRRRDAELRRGDAARRRGGELRRGDAARRCGGDMRRGDAVLKTLCEDTA